MADYPVSYDEAVEELPFQIEEEQYGAFIFAGLQPDGRPHSIEVADGNKIPDDMSKQQAKMACLAQLLDHLGIRQIDLVQMLLTEHNLSTELDPPDDPF